MGYTNVPFQIAFTSTPSTLLKEQKHAERKYGFDSETYTRRKNEGSNIKLSIGSTVRIMFAAILIVFIRILELKIHLANNNKNSA